MYQNFIGIDISKHTFVIAIHDQEIVQTFSNDQIGFQAFLNKFKKVLINSLVVLETTGGYEVALIEHIQSERLSIHRANTRKVKHFIRSYGTWAKTDKIDAKALALYGAERHQKLELFKENPYKSLLKLIQRRGDLIQMLVQEKNRLQAPDQFECRNSFETIIKVLTKELNLINTRIEELCKSFKHIADQKKALKTIKGIGEVIAVQLLALMPELGTLDRKKIASLAGLAPHPNQSGKRKGYSSVKGGRSEVKPVLFMAALTASRSNSPLGDFYKKLLAAGKKKMVALTALMRKILVIANAKIRDYLAIKSSDLQHG